MFKTIKLTFALLVLVCCQVAIADIVISPPGLNIGDQYRLVFVTSGTRNAQSSNIADYNSFVTAQANQNAVLSALNTTWTVIGSTATVDARDNPHGPRWPSFPSSSLVTSRPRSSALSLGIDFSSTYSPYECRVGDERGGRTGWLAELRVREAALPECAFPSWSLEWSWTIG